MWYNQPLIAFQNQCILSSKIDEKTFRLSAVFDFGAITRPKMSTVVKANIGNRLRQNGLKCEQTTVNELNSAKHFLGRVHSPLKSRKAARLHFESGADWRLRVQWCEWYVGHWVKWRARPKKVIMHINQFACYFSSRRFHGIFAHQICTRLTVCFVVLTMSNFTAYADVCCA